MALAKGYPFEMQGRLAEATDVCESAVEATRLADNPQYLFWALSEARLGVLLQGRPRRRDRCVRGERAHREAHGGRHDAGRREAGPAGRWAARSSRRARSNAPSRSCTASGRRSCRTRSPWRRCFDWEILGLVEIALGNPRRPRATWCAPRRTPRSSASAAAGGARAARPSRPAARPGRAARGRRAGAGVRREGRRDRRRAGGRVRPQPGGPRPRRGGGARARRSPLLKRGREGTRRVRLAARARRDAARAAQARRPRRDARARRPARTRGSRRSPSASSRSPTWSPTA